MKQCLSCGETKPLSEYGKDKHRSDGLLGNCKVCRNAKNRAYMQTPERKAWRAKWKEKNADRLRQKNKEWRLANFDRQAKNIKEWFARNRDKARAYSLQSNAKRQADPVYNMHSRISRSLRMSLGSRFNSDKFRMLGYTPQELAAHLERQFLKGMSWENRGEWQIDHIRPLKSFSFSGPNDPQVVKAWALPNLRPLWRSDNARKGARLEKLL